MNLGRLNEGELDIKDIRLTGNRSLLHLSLVPKCFFGTSRVPDPDFKLELWPLVLNSYVNDLNASAKRWKMVNEEYMRKHRFSSPWPVSGSFEDDTMV